MGGSSTSTQKSEPSDFIKPYLSEALGGAQAQYQAGAPKYYEGSTVPTDILNRTQNYALTSQGNRAGQMAGSNNAMNQFAGGNLGDWGTVDQMRGLGAANNYGQDQGVANIMARMGRGTDLARNLETRTGDIVANGGDIGGYSSSMIGDIARSGGGIGGFSDRRVGDLSTAGPNTLAQFRSDVGDIISGRAQGLNPAMVPLMDTAGGGYLNANPYLNSAFTKAADNVTRAYQTGTAPAIDSAFSRSSGALRSGAAMNARDQAQENLGKTLGNLATDIYGGNYATERQNQLSAANALGSLYQSGLGLRTSAAGTSAGQGTADASTRLAATGQVAGDMSGDLARRLSATGQISSDMSGDLARRMSASDAMTRAEQGDLNNFMAANDRLSQAFNTGADRQMAALNSSNNMYNASRAQQLQALGMQPGFMQAQQQMDYNDLAAAQQAAQTGINADIERWDYNQNKDRNNVNWYMNAINGMPTGQTSSITQRGGMAGLGGGLSGASSAAMIMKMLGLF